MKFKEAIYRSTIYTVLCIICTTVFMLVVTDDSLIDILLSEALITVYAMFKIKLIYNIIFDNVKDKVK
jgi:hypothetical protein